MKKKINLKNNISKISSNIILNKSKLKRKQNLKYKFKEKLKKFKHKENGRNNRGSLDNKNTKLINLKLN